MAHLRWWLLLAAAALLVLANLVVLTAQPAHRVVSPPASSAAEPDAGRRATRESLPRCPDADAVPPPLLPDAPNPPVVLWADDGVELFIDEQRATSPVATPRHFVPGEHALRAEAAGEKSVSVTLRLAPWQAALVHVESRPRVGLTLVFLGAECLACGTRRETPFPLTPTPEAKGAVVPFADAAAALRDADTDRAAALLAGVAQSRRNEPLYRRLVAWLHGATGQSTAARPEVERAAELGAGSTLAGVLRAWNDASAREPLRRQEVAVQRWNLLTERFGRLVSSLPQAAPGQTNATAAKLETLGAQAKEARFKGDLAAQEQLVDEGEAAVRAWVRALRAQQPADCAFQQKVTREL